MPMKRNKMLLSLVAVVALVSCQSPTDSIERAPADVQAFLAEDAGRPFHGGSRVVLPSSDVLMYFVKYGPGLDCLSGCFYARALLLKSGGRIGWVEGHSPAPSRATFQMQAQDSTLFTKAFFDDLLPRDREAHGQLGLAFFCSGHMPQSLKESMTSANPNTTNTLSCRR